MRHFDFVTFDDPEFVRDTPHARVSLYLGAPLNYHAEKVGRAFDTTAFRTVSAQQLLQIRAESFNLRDKPPFGAASLTAAWASFSAVTTRTDNPRHIHFGARVAF